MDSSCSEEGVTLGWHSCLFVTHLLAWQGRVGWQKGLSGKRTDWWCEGVTGDTWYEKVGSQDSAESGRLGEFGVANPQGALNA